MKAYIFSEVDMFDIDFNIKLAGSSL